MWLADGWKDYEVIDTSDGEKLERWGDTYQLDLILRSFGILQRKINVGIN